MFKKTLLATAFALSGFTMTAAASTQTTTFQVTATVINDCIISSSNIAFGNYDPTVATAVTNSAGAVTATCTMGDSVSVALGQGANAGTGSTAAVPARQMVSGTNKLPYHIYIASTGTTEWGTGTVGTNEPAAQTSVSVLTPLSFPLYGSIPAGENVPAGSYTDSVIATVTY